MIALLPCLRRLCALLLPAVLLISAGACGGPAVDPTATPVPLGAADTAPPLVLPTLAPLTVTPAPPTATALPATPTPRPASPTPTPTATPGPPPRVPALVYHLIDIPAGGEMNVPSDGFADQMRWLHDNAYHPISPAQLVAALHGQGTLPPHPILVSFDDNQVSPYVHALPVLKEYGFTAAFFIDTVTIGKDGFMDADQIKELADQGFTIGSHTWDHRILPQQDDKELTRQITMSTDDLTAILGHPPVFFSYPAGLYDQRVVDAIKAHGYQGAFRLFDRDDPVVDDPAFMIRRAIIPGEWSTDEFADAVHAMEPRTPTPPPAP